MAELLNVPVVIENRAGANQVAAIRMVQAAAPDGYTLLAGTGSFLVQNPALRKNLYYDPLKNFTLVGMAVINAAVIVISPDVPVKSLAEFISYVGARPGELNYGSGGVGSAGHIFAEALLTLTGLKMTHVAYHGDPDVLLDLTRGTVKMAVLTTLNTTSLIKAGKINALATTTSERVPYLPDVPTLAETRVSGLAELAPYTFISFVGPEGLPAQVTAKLNEAINNVSQTPELAARVRDTLYSTPAISSPAGFRAFVVTEIEKWRRFGDRLNLPAIASPG
jgi:tripartite-type tricarboxylate transporter receptor subunit TctC